MRWRISIEGSDEITRGHRLEFEIEKSLDDLAAGSLGLSVDDGETSWDRFSGTSSRSNAPFMFCSDVTAKDVAERDRSRTIRPERSRQFTALSLFLCQDWQRVQPASANNAPQRIERSRGYAGRRRRCLASSW